MHSFLRRIFFLFSKLEIPKRNFKLTLVINSSLFILGPIKMILSFNDIISLATSVAFTAATATIITTR